MKSEQINSYTEVKQKTDRDVRQLGILVSESYEAESTDQQTVINLNFSVDINNKKQVWVFIDGQKLVEGTTGNYTFTNVTSNVSAQITLNAPLMAGLPIQVYKLGAYQESFPNPSSVTATLLNDVAQPHKMALDGFQNFVKKTFITAPNTTIQNRAQVEAGSLKAIAGIERIPVRGIVQSRTEFGSVGEAVWELDSKDSRIRFVGNWISANSANGNYITNNLATDYVEVTFYGTGLNYLGAFATATYTQQISIDGGASTNFINTAMHGVSLGRNYNQNVVVSIVSGLTLGWHTAKLTYTAGGYNVYGFEILNERSNLAVLAGTAYGGMKQEVLNTLSNSAFNTGIVGTRGARVVKYLQNGVISQVVQEVNSASAFLTSADHTNEEVVRRINFAEFGANRSDDFSTLTGAASNRAFILDDGTTSLVGLGVYLNPTTKGCGLASNPSFLTLTFVGTGLDMVKVDSATGGTDSYNIQVDGGATQALPSTGDTTLKTVKLVSGLPYGTHIVRINRASAVTWEMDIYDFIIYQPKKPSIPSGAIELCDYNVVANYIANSTVSLLNLGQGVIRKSALREITYVGATTNWDAANTGSQYSQLFLMQANVLGNYAEYTFYGTGFDFRYSVSNSNNATAVTVTVDGSSNLSTYTTSVYGGQAFTAATGVLNQNPITISNSDGGLSVSGLTLGKHTIRVTFTTGTAMRVSCFDIITPIHINTTSMKVGSMSLTDRRVFSPIVDKPDVIDMAKSKAWLNYDGVNNKILSSFNIAAVLKVATGNYLVYFIKPFKNINYSCVITASQWNTLIASQNSNYITTYSGNAGGTNLDSGLINYLFFGELEDEGEI
jgi:hypothetical protein